MEIDFTGPVGGLLAMAYGLGCLSSYAFFNKAFAATFKAQLAEQKIDIRELRAKIDDLQEERLKDIKAGVAK